MLPIQKLLINANYSKGAVITPKYIIIHESGNPDKGANAIANRNYFANHPEAQASAHFCVDDHSIVQCLELNQRGWHIGVIYGHPVNNPLATNSNTIGIEICVNSDGDFSKARANAIDLTKYLMRVLHISANNVIRHYDACKKDCPQKMLATPSLWVDFKARILSTVTIPIAKVGWVLENNIWYFYRNNKKEINAWELDSHGKWFFLGANGAMVINEWHIDSHQKWFYLGGTGEMVKNSWQLDSHNKWFYLGDTGEMVINFWVHYQGKQYWVGPTGEMAINTTIDGWVVGSDGAWDGKAQIK